ncbi:MAG: sulfatase [Spirochaetes bacterium]|nr:sulfatase [Spirochaetota bacterium]
MEKKITRKELVKKSLKIGSAAGGAALLGAGAWKFLRTATIEELYGTYPGGAADYQLQIINTDAPKPNFIIIYCDDLGYGDLGCYGNRVIRTPHIDGLARGGTKFTDYYACSAVCGPSRAGLLTGRYPFRTGIIGNVYPKDEPYGRVLARKFGSALKALGVMDMREDYVARGISRHEITLAEGLKRAGYRTGMVGKWHLGDYSRQPEFNPRRHGFDSYFGVPHSNDMIPCPLFRNEEMLEADIGTNQARITGLYTAEALKFIDESGDRPFFLYLAHTFPHQPLYASERFEKKSKGGIFGDAVEEIDWSTGEIVNLLKRKGLENNTVIVFTSDNGPWYEGSPGELRGRKGQSYEGGFRCPFIARWPGRIPAGRTSKVPLMNLDLYPTFFHLAGVGLPGDRIVDGKNIFGVLTGKKGDRPHEAIYFYHYDLLEGIRMGRWKYFEKMNRYVWPIALDAAPVPNRLGSKQMGKRWPLLYDLENDPGESYNVINTHPGVAEKLKAAMESWQHAVDKNPRGFGPS